MTRELTVTVVWWCGKQCFNMARTFANWIFLESSEAWRKRTQRNSGGPALRPASSTAVSLATCWLPSSRAIFLTEREGGGPVLCCLELVGGKEVLVLLCPGVGSWYEQEESQSFWHFHTLVDGKGALAALQLEAETRLFSLQQAKCLGQEKWLLLCSWPHVRRGSFSWEFAGIYENFQLPFLLCLPKPRVLMIIINLGCSLSEEAFIFGAV